MRNLFHNLLREGIKGHPALIQPIVIGAAQVFAAGHALVILQRVVVIFRIFRLDGSAERLRRQFLRHLELGIGGKAGNPQDVAARREGNLHRERTVLNARYRRFDHLAEIAAFHDHIGFVDRRRISRGRPDAIPHADVDRIGPCLLRDYLIIGKCRAHTVDAVCLNIGQRLDVGVVGSAKAAATRIVFPAGLDGDLVGHGIKLALIARRLFIGNRGQLGI